MKEFSIVIRNGRIIDGSGNPWFKGDVGIDGDRINRVGNLGQFEAESEIDAKELFVCPGFIDVHSHSDVSFFVNQKADSKITQGVTSEIVGNCGHSAAPITELGKTFYAKGYEEKGIDWNWSTVAEYLKQLEDQGIPLNVGTLIGHGNIRASVMGYDDRNPTLEELESMKKLVEEGMRDGAFGISTGLKYAPGCYAKTDEIVELCKVVQRYGGIYATHIRNQGDFLIESIDEAIEIGRRSGVPIQISHLKSKGRSNWGKARNMLRIISEARVSGVDVTFDQYPYLAGQSNLISRAPSWAREGGPECLLERLKDPKQRKMIEVEIPKSEDWHGPENTIIAGFAPNRSYEGKSLKELGNIRDQTPESVVCNLLLESEGVVPVVSFYGWEKDIRDIMTHHAMMVGSDGSSLAPYGVLGRGKPHPRSYGCFSRFLGRYVLKEGLLNVEEGVRRTTYFPARRFGLLDRGLLRKNMFADLLIIDAEKVVDVATFEDPHKYSKGIEYVLINGKMVIKNGNFTGILAGKTLKHVIYNN